NRQVRENTIVQIQEIIYRVWSYLLEFDAVHAKLPRRLIGPKRWRPPEGSCLKVNFDAAFHAPMLMTCVGIVIKDNLGSVVGYTSIFLHVPHEGNSVAHLLASKGLQGEGRVIQRRGIPEFALLAVETDRCGSGFIGGSLGVSMVSWCLQMFSSTLGQDSGSLCVSGSLFFQLDGASFNWFGATSIDDFVWFWQRLFGYG
ncbi:hypothetical protein Gotri_020684, partial [Gossypium trilobum]|nr:hypothetical protein [Gossypium trilobum]